MAAIDKIKAYLLDNELNFKDMSGKDFILLRVEYNLTDKQLRGLINVIMKNKFRIEFENNAGYIGPAHFTA